MGSMASGERITCIGMTEPGTGSDLQGLKTNAVKDGDDFIINGSKVFISNGIMADTCILAAVTDQEATNKAAGISLFVVDTNTPGYNKGKMLKKVGLNGQGNDSLLRSKPLRWSKVVLKELENMSKK